MFMDAKHHELFGNLCSTGEFSKEWQETCSKDGISFFKRGNFGGSILIRRADFKIKNSIDKIYQIASDHKSLWELVTPLESVQYLESIKDVCICSLKGSKLSEKEPARDTVVACQAKKYGDCFTLVRSSIQYDKAPKFAEGHLQAIISLSGMVVYKKEAEDVFVSFISVLDTEKPFLDDTFKNLDVMMLERIKKFR
jgi:hypothetical protein